MVRDEDLIRRAAGGDEVAFALIYERHRHGVFGFATGCWVLHDPSYKETGVGAADRIESVVPRR